MSLVIPPHSTWKDNLTSREEALRHRHTTAMERWTEHSRTLPPLRIGDHVRVQNQTGHHPTKWDRTATVIEVKQYHQYTVRMDGSGRLSLCNRRFLRKYTPARPPAARRTITEDMIHIPPATWPKDSPATPQTDPPPQPVSPDPPPQPVNQPPPPVAITWDTTPPRRIPEDHHQATPAAQQPASPAPRDIQPEQPTSPPPRRSTRTRQQPDWLF